MPTVVLTDQQLDMLQQAIDSHIYWQLSDPSYRKDGGVIDPASDDEDDRAEIASFRALGNYLVQV